MTIAPAISTTAAHGRELATSRMGTRAKPPGRSAGSPGREAIAGAARPGRANIRTGFYQRQIEVDIALDRLIRKEDHRKILIEVKTQFYGRARSDTVSLVPSEVARVHGMLPGNATRAITGLVDMGVLVRIDGPIYGFVEDWRSWKLDGDPAERERYIVEVARRARSGHHAPGSSTRPERSASAYRQGLLFDPNEPPGRSADQPRAEATSTPGRRPSPARAQAQDVSPAITDPISRDSVALSPGIAPVPAPIEERARSKNPDRRKERGEESPHPLSASPRNTEAGRGAESTPKPNTPEAETIAPPGIDPSNRAELDKVAALCRESFPRRPEIAEAVARRQGGHPIAWYGQAAAKLRDKPPHLQKRDYFLGILRNFDPDEAERAGPAEPTTRIPPRHVPNAAQLAQRRARATERAHRSIQGPIPPQTFNARTCP